MQEPSSLKLYGKIAIMALLDLARCDARLTSNDVVILQALGSKVHKTTTSTRTATSIAAEMGCSHTTINKRIKRLLHYGYVFRQKETRRGRPNKFVYTFNLELIETHHEHLSEYRQHTTHLKTYETSKAFLALNLTDASNSETLESFTMKQDKNKENANTNPGYTSVGDVAFRALKNLALGKSGALQKKA